MDPQASPHARRPTHRDLAPATRRPLGAAGCALPLRLLGALMFALLAAACEPAGAALTVDLRTDVSPGNEFVAIRTEISSEPFGAALGSEEVFADTAFDYAEGRRIAGFAGLTPGTLFVRVQLLGRFGQRLVERISTVSVRERSSIVVVIARTCREVTCPAPDGDPEATSCAAGRCVPPGCTPDTPELCGEPECRLDADCPSEVGCAEGRCIAGECLQVAIPNACDVGLWCDPSQGCVPTDTPVADGGTCATRETSCTDELDEDCDGLVDCEDPDCLGSSCDDGSACTTDDVCIAGGACAGTPTVCDDDNGCTDDSCDPETGECIFAPNTEPCDDGLFCNGDDTCEDGACTRHSGSPCTNFCTETSRSCAQCLSNADCGANTAIQWGACSFPDACATTGTQTGTRTVHTCVSGMCRSETVRETRSCTRASRQGVQCGSSTRNRCCGGSCVDTWTSEAHCGGCGLRCASGLNCRTVRQGGGAACYACSSNAQCNGGVVNRDLVTCWLRSAGGGDFCRCQSDAFCAAGQRCATVGSGQDRYCYYP